MSSEDFLVINVIDVGTIPAVALDRGKPYPHKDSELWKPASYS